MAGIISLTTHLEFGLRAVPALIFLVCAFIRFKQIQPIGFGKTVDFTRFFLFKWLLQYMQAAIEILILVSILADWAYRGTQGGKIQASAKYLSLLMIINIAAWVVSGRFLWYEYRKRLSEGFFTHQLFWVLSLIFDGWLTYRYYGNYVISLSYMTF